MKIQRRSDGSLGLMGHVIADYPSGLAVRSMIKAMADAGVAVIEIQIPFSEPMADGPVFLAANHKALQQGVDYAASVKLMAEVTKAYPQVSFLFMTYLNVLYQRGYPTFAAEAQRAGAKGVVVPDLPVDESKPLDEACAAHGLVNVRLIPPNMQDERLVLSCKGAAGLIYAVARSGVTGARTSFGGEVKESVERIRKHTQVPVAVGFGVRSATDLKMLRGVADMAIVGTASLDAYQKGGLDAFTALWQSLAAAAK